MAHNKIHYYPSISIYFLQRTTIDLYIIYMLRSSKIKHIIQYVRFQKCFLHASSIFFPTRLLNHFSLQIAWLTRQSQRPIWESNFLSLTLNITVSNVNFRYDTYYCNGIHTIKSFLTASKMSSIKNIDLCSKLFSSWDSLQSKSNIVSNNISEWKRDTKSLLSLISVILRSPNDNIATHSPSWILYLLSTSFQSLKQ